MNNYAFSAAGSARPRAPLSAIVYVIVPPPGAVFGQKLQKTGRKTANLTDFQRKFEKITIL